MGEIKYIDYSNKSILFIDLSGSMSDYEIIDLGDKAKKLVKLASRTRVFLVYNLSDITLTKKIMIRLKNLMSNSYLVERRVFFGVPEKYQKLLESMFYILNIDKNTRFASSYTEALNKIVDDDEWRVERRKVEIKVEEDRRAPLPSDEEFEEKMNSSIEDLSMDMDWDIDFK